MQNYHTLRPDGEIKRPDFYGWMKSRGLTIGGVADIFEVSASVMARSLLRADHPGYRPPSFELRQKVRDFTSGEIDLENWPERIDRPASRVSEWRRMRNTKRFLAGHDIAGADV